MTQKFQPPRGTRDFLSEEMIRREFVLEKIKQVFEKWGFDPLDTPAFEDWKLLSAKFGGGEEIKKEIYYFKDKSDRELGLRFDLTVPLARVVATNLDLPKPFRRYQVGKVWRYDRPGFGRFREFWQADIDTVGSNKPETDAEIMACTCDVFKTLGFKDQYIRLNNRKIVEGLVLKLGIKKDRVFDVFRSIDKLEKFGEDDVRKELKMKGVSAKAINEIIKFTKIKGNPKQVLEKAKKMILDQKIGLEGIKELEEMMKSLKALGFDKDVYIDLSLVRGLEYYTGPVFEAVIKKGKWSLAGGGRYDNMIKLFSGPDTPATGISLGVERIMEVMKERKMFIALKSKTKVFVAAVNDEVRRESVKIAKKLREKGINAQTDVMGRNLRKQLEYADSLGIPYVVIVGPKELKKKKVMLRDMKRKKESEVKIKDLIKKLS